MTSFVLKITAVLSMLTDHITVVFGLDDWLLIIGSIAFPLYAFMIVDSFRHLQDKPERFEKFMLSLGVMAIISEAAYDYCSQGTFHFLIEQNQLFQFISFGIVLELTRRTRDRRLRIIYWILGMLVNQLLMLGYSLGGFLLMMMYQWYLDRRDRHGMGWRWITVLGVFVLLIVFSGITEALIAWQIGEISSLAEAWTVAVSSVTLYLSTFLAVPFIVLHNGKYGRIPKWFRKAYRYFYPAHLWILALIHFFFVK